MDLDPAAESACPIITNPDAQRLAAIPSPQSMGEAREHQKFSSYVQNMNHCEEGYESETSTHNIRTGRYN
jgi:hypothetical protein